MKKNLLLTCFTMFVILIISAQEIAINGTRNIKLGMSLQRVKSLFPNARFKKEIFEATEESNEGFITAIISDKYGKVSIRAYFDEMQKINYIDFFNDFNHYNVSPGDLFKELKDKGLVKSIDYTPDGEGNRIGLWVTLNTAKNIEALLELPKELKDKLAKYEYKPVPIEKIPLTVRIKCMRVFKSN